MSDERGRGDTQFPTFGRFKTQAELGRGAMGRVYRVIDPSSGGELALKTITTDAAEHIFWLKREFRTLAELHHPNLVQFHELFSSVDSTFFTMELIEGAHFTTALRGQAGNVIPVDLRAFASAVSQLAEGVGYLHGRGKLHRDLKPSNVLIGRDGRVVLLDFGLATSSVEMPREEDGAAGTLAYMAPECFLRAAPAPATDWYSVGVMLYEVLAGRLPFEPTQTQVLAKQRERYRPLTEIAPETPAPLIDLVHSLLAANPGSRGDLLAVRQRLGESHRRSHLRLQMNLAAESLPFVGRSNELAVLGDAMSGALEDKPGLVICEGRSGEGKTTLIEHFLSQGMNSEQPLILRGRCHPSEFVAFKALDGVVDALSDHLASLGDAASAFLGPQHHALCRVFPVLSRVGVESSIHSATPSDAFELRRAAFTALRDLFHQVSQSRPVVIWIDDLQWGQEDSGRLLCELLRPAPGVPILFIFSFRSDERETSQCIRVIDHGLAAGDFDGLRVDHIVVQPMDDASARRLARTVLNMLGDADPANAEQHAELITRSARGNAFILTEFARHVASNLNESGVSLAPSLEHMLEWRFERLPDLARRIMSTSVTAGRPLSRDVLLAASEADFRGPAMLQVLIKSSLLRTIDIDTGAGYLAYHDQIRDALLHIVPPGEQRQCHARIAATLLETLDPDPEHLLEHLLHSGQNARAAPFAYRAATRAASILAFERASELFGLVLSLGYPALPSWSLRIRQAEALANAGRGRQSAEAFLAAAGVLPPDETSVTASDLRRRAAEQYLHAGCLPEGEKVLGELLASIGVELPRTTLQATLRSIAKRLWINLRGRKYQLRSDREVSPAALERADLLWAGTTGLGMINHTRADAINVELLGEVLRLGERSRVARVLGFEAAAEASIGGFLMERSSKTLAEAGRVAAESADAYDRAWVLQASSAVHWFQERWRTAFEAGEESIQLYRGLGRGTQWEQAVVQTFRLSALAQLGRFEALAREIPNLLNDATERGDIFAAAVLDGSAGLVWLARDNPERALQIAQQAVRPWPEAPFLACHYRHLISTASALLYLDRDLDAFELVTKQWGPARSARFLMLAYIGSELRFLKGRAGLARLAQLQDAPERRALVRSVEAESRQLARKRSSYARAAARCLEAGLLAQAGSPERAAQSLEAAEALFEQLEMAAMGSCCRWLRGRLMQDDEIVELSARRLMAMGVLRPERLARCLVGKIVTSSEATRSASA